MDVFLQKLARYVTAEKQMEPHSLVALSVSRFVRYRKSHLSVSLTEAGVTGPMRVMACSNATADMTFMTAGGVATVPRIHTIRQKHTQRAHTADPRGKESNWNIKE
jgi:hypothetical protein